MKTFIFCVLSPLVNALVFPGPQPTSPSDDKDLALKGTSPRPTGGIEPVDLRKRAGQTLLLAPDNTCGYLSASSVTYYDPCDKDQTCGYSAGVGVYCGKGTNPASYTPVDYQTQCYGYSNSASYTAALVSCSTDAACRSSSLVFRCTDTSAMYCQLATISGLGAQFLYCNSTIQSSGSTAVVATTYRGGPTRILTPISPASTAASTTTSGSVSTTRRTTTITTQASSSSTGIPTFSSAGTASTADIASTAGVVDSGAQTSAAVVSSSSGAPIGAIVGGVVGGVAVIALIALGTFLFVRNSRKNEAAHAAAAANPNGGNPPPGDYYQQSQGASPGPGEKLGPMAYATPVQNYNQGYNSPPHASPTISDQQTYNQQTPYYATPQQPYGAPQQQGQQQYSPPQPYQQQSYGSPQQYQAYNGQQQAAGYTSPNSAYPQSPPPATVHSPPPPQVNNAGGTVPGARPDVHEM